MQVIFKSISLLELVIYFTSGLIWIGLLWWLYNDEHHKDIAMKHCHRVKNTHSGTTRR